MTILILPGLLPYAEEVPNLRELAAQGRVRRLTPVVGIPEAAWVGLPPTRIADGPLMVSAFGIEPPERSIQFHLSLLSLVEGNLGSAPGPTAAEAAKIQPLLTKLDTKKLKSIVGEGLDHALVLEGFADLATTSASDATGKSMSASLPEGDIEPALRRYIDDSVNMLSELELNRRRIDQEIAPLNVFWPWGHGAPKRLSNLALGRGEPLVVQSDSLRMRGLARLVGYRPAPRLASGVETKWASIQEGGIVTIGTLAGREEEEAVWIAREIGKRLLSRIEGEFVLVSDGLVLEVGDKAPADSVPFREDVAQDGAISAVDLWGVVEQALGS